MKFKPGDLVVIVGCENPNLKHYIGAIRTVLMPSEVYIGRWLLDPPTISAIGGRGSWLEKHLKIIRDQDGEDEMLRIAGYPHKETA